MSKAINSLRDTQPALSISGEPVWLSDLDPTGATNNQVVTFDGNLGLS